MSRKNKIFSGAPQVTEPKVSTTEKEVATESTETNVTTTVTTEGTEGVVVTGVDGTDESTDTELETGADSDIIDDINEELVQLQSTVVETETTVTTEAEVAVGSEPALAVAAVSPDVRPLHLKLIEQWLIGDSESEQAYVVAMAPGRTITLPILFHQQQTLITVIRYILGLKGQDFFEAMDRWLEIVDQYSDGAFGPKYALRGLNEKTAPFTKESAELLQRFVTLSQRIANANSRNFVLKQCVDTTVALNKLMDADAREKLNAWFSQYE